MRHGQEMEMCCDWEAAWEGATSDHSKRHQADSRV
jgi:hypothetical protein